MGIHARTSRHRLLSALVSGGALLILSSCGGSSSSPQGAVAAAPTPTATATPTASSAALYLTDDFSNDYDAVWLTVTRITAVQGTVETDLATFSPAQVVNLPQLKRSGLFIGNTAIPAGTTAFRVYVGSDAKIVGLDGTLQTVQLARSAGGYLEFSVTTAVTQSGVVALDFDLPHFVLSGGVLTPATRIADSTDQAQWTNRHGELRGKVVAVTASLLTLDLTTGARVDITLDANTTYRSATNVAFVPTVGQQVEVDVLLGGTTAAPTYTARSVHDDTLFTTTAGTTSRPEVDGTVVSVSGTTVVVDITRSEDLTLTGRVTFDTAGAIFKRGTAALLVPGVTIEGHVSRATSTPLFVTLEIAGAAKTETIVTPTGSTSTVTTGHADVQASVVAVNGSKIDVKIFKLDGLPAYTVGSTITLDTTGAYFERGSLSCLVAGSPIGADGYLDAAGKFVVVKVDLEGACGAGASSGATTTVGQLSEATGTIQSVGTGQFTLQLFKSENWVGTLPTSVTVTYDTTTRFDEISAATLAAGQFVTVKGVVGTGTLAAKRVSKD